MNIEQLALEIGRKLNLALQQILCDLGSPVPRDLEPKIILRDKTGGKKRRNASADNWSRCGSVLRRLDYGQPTAAMMVPTKLS